MSQPIRGGDLERVAIPVHPAAQRAEVGHRPQGGNGDRTPHIVRGPDGRVHILQEKGQPYADEQAAGRRHQQVARDLRGRRISRHLRPFADLQVRDRDIVRHGGLV